MYFSQGSLLKVLFAQNQLLFSRYLYAPRNGPLILFVVQRDDPGLIIGILHGGNNFDRESVNGSTRGSLLQVLFAVCYVFKNFNEEIQSSLTPSAKQFVANVMLLFILTRSMFTAWLFQVSSDI